MLAGEQIRIVYNRRERSFEVVGDVCYQLGLQSFALYSFRQSRRKSASDAVHRLCLRFVIGRHVFYVYLAVNLTVCDLLANAVYFVLLIADVDENGRENGESEKKQKDHRAVKIIM